MSNKMIIITKTMQLQDGQTRYKNHVYKNNFTPSGIRYTSIGLTDEATVKIGCEKAAKEKYKHYIENVNGDAIACALCSN